MECGQTSAPSRADERTPKLSQWVPRKCAYMIYIYMYIYHIYHNI